MFKNKKIIYVLLPAVGLLILLVFIKYKNSKNSINANKPVVQERVKVPEKDKSRDTIESKLTLYELDRNEKDKDLKNKDNQRKTFDELMKEMNEKKNSNKGIDQNGADFLKKDSSPVNKSFNRPPKRKKDIEKSDGDPNGSSKDNKKEKNKIDDESGYGFGVYVADHSEQKNTPSDEFYSAYIEDDVILKRNTGFTLLLDKECTINGVVYKKYSVAYAKAIGGSDRMDCIVTMIENAYDGKKNYVKLYMYNENYIRGLDYPGTINEGVKQSASDVSDQAASEAGTTGSTLTTIKNNLWNREKEIPLYKRYRVYLKENEDGNKK
jgi:hypothetical protein